MSWPQVTLNDVCSSIQYGYTASANTAAVGPKFLRITDIVDNTIMWDKVPYCEIEPKYKDKYSLREGDIVVARTGATVGHAKQIRRAISAVFASYLVRFRILNDVEPKFIGAVIESADYKKWVRLHAGGAAQPNANARVLGAYPFALPPLSTQRRIASILSAYDDLIEVNRRRVAILEEMARRLFEEWFVHLRFPGHAAVPLHDTPDGPLPEGWSFGVVRDLLTLHRGYDLATTARNPGTVPVMTGSGHNGWHDASKVAGPGVVTGRSGTVGQVFLIHEHFWPLNTALYVSEYRGTTPVFALFVLRALKLASHAGGAAVPTLNRNHVHALPIRKPPIELTQQFDKIATPILTNIRVLEKQNNMLAAARDLLLPRLLSGQLPIAEAPAPERFLAAAE